MTKTFSIGAGVLALGMSIAGSTLGAQLPSPCQAGEPGASLSCVYLDPPSSSYQGDGTRDGSALQGSTFSVAVYIDFRPEYTTGGGFDITYDPAAVAAISFAFDAGFQSDGGSFNTTGTDNGTGTLDGIGFGAFNGLGGEDSGGTPGGPAQYPGLQLMGALTIMLDAGFTGFTDFLFVESTPSDFPSNFVGGPDFSSDIDVNFYGSTVDVLPVPLPAGVWLLISGVATLCGFRRAARHQS